jgi:hypothetical protein
MQIICQHIDYVCRLTHLHLILFTSTAQIYNRVSPPSFSPPPFSPPLKHPKDKTMCTSYRTYYLICKSEDLARGPDNNIPCVDEEFNQCRKAKESSQNCSEPFISPLWINYKCCEHGGPSPQKREKAMRKIESQSRERQERERQERERQERERQERERQERERQEGERQERERQIMVMKEHRPGEWSNAGCWIM